MKPTVKGIAKAISEGFQAAPVEPSPPPPAPIAAAQPSLPLEEPVKKDDLVELKPTPELNPRNLAMAEIAKRSNAERDAESKETAVVTDEEGNVVPPQPVVPEAALNDDDTDGEPLPAQPAAPAAEETPAETEPQPAPAQAAPEGIDPNAEYELMVEGQPMKFKGSQIIDSGRRTLQKETAADYKLKLASEVLERAKQQNPSQAAGTPSGKPADQPAAAAPAGQLSDAELAEAVQFGDSHKAASAIAEIRRRDPNAVTVEGMQNFMREQLPAIVRKELAYDAATRFAKAEYDDILQDPYLGPVFFQEELRLRQAGDNRVPIDLYKAIGDGLRKHFNRPKPTGTNLPATTPTQKPAAQTATRDQRLAAKAAAPVAPKLASARIEGGTGAEKPKTREEIIQGMRRSRGQDQPRTS